MSLVNEVMVKDMVCCFPASSLEELKKVTEKFKCSKIPVINKHRMIVGTIDLEVFENSSGRFVAECMTKNVKVVEEDSTLDECLRMMILNGIDEVPVIDKQGHYCGIIKERHLIGIKP